MKYEQIEFAERLIRRVEDNEEHWDIAGEPVGTTPIVTMQDDEIYAFLAPIYADWCE